MIRRLRLLVLLCRPAALVIFALFAALGLAQGGAPDDALLLGRALVVVTAYLLFSVALNDLADEEVDRVNLPGSAGRPLVTGAGTRAELPLVAGAAALAALGTAATIGGPALAVVAAGLALSAAYSWPGVGLARRGIVASLVLPAGYVAVPYLVGLLGARPVPTATDLALLGGLYLGFVGRILLKDFRDVRGDALFGKRTYLVRHGRRPTCAVSAVAWTAGSLALLAVRQVTPALVAAHAAWVVIALVLLRALSVDGGPRRDEALVSALAIAGRGLVLTLLVHLGMAGAAWPPAAAGAVTLALVAVVGGQAVTMARHGPPAVAFGHETDVERRFVAERVAATGGGGRRAPAGVVAGPRASPAGGSAQGFRRTSSTARMWSVGSP